MPELIYVATCLMLGWCGGKIFSYLQRAGATGGWSPQHWLSFVGALVVAMLFAKFGVGFAGRYFRINDLAVGGGGIAMLLVFAATAYRGSRSTHV